MFISFFYGMDGVLNEVVLYFLLFVWDFVFFFVDVGMLLFSSMIMLLNFFESFFIFKVE